MFDDHYPNDAANTTQGGTETVVTVVTADSYGAPPTNEGLSDQQIAGLVLGSLVLILLAILLLAIRFRKLIGKSLMRLWRFGTAKRIQRFALLVVIVGLLTCSYAYYQDVRYGYSRDRIYWIGSGLLLLGLLFSWLYFIPAKIIKWVSRGA